MATADGGNSAVVNALVLGQIERVHLLIEESPLDLQRAAEVVIDKGQCEALKFLLSNHELDVDKHFLLHRALVAQEEDIAKMLVESGADVNNYEKIDSGYRDWGEEGCAHYSCYLPLQLSLFSSLDMTRFLLESGAAIDQMNFFCETTLQFICRMSVLSLRVAFLLGKRAMTHVKECDIETANASDAQMVERMILLIDNGVNMNRFLCNDPALSILCSSSESFDCLKTLLEKGADCRVVKCFYGETGLHLAAKSGNSMALKLLIQYGAQLEARSRDGDTALILACGESVPTECVRILLESKAFPCVRNMCKRTPLSIAKETKNEEKIQMLLRYGATEGDRIDQEETDLMLACGKTGNVKPVLSLLQNKASPNVKNHRGETALHIAADRGDIEILKVLVQYKADVNAMTDHDKTPLMLACANSSVKAESVMFLLDNNALPNVTDIFSKTALSKAGHSKDIEKIKLLVQYGADVNVRDVNQATPLLLACAEKSVDIEYVKFLLENEALPNVADIQYDTALHRAVSLGNVELIRILVQYGADVTAVDRRWSPLVLACFEKSVTVECVKLLLESKTLSNVNDALNPWPVLHWTFESRDIEKVKILIRHGADVNKRYQNRTFLMFIVCSCYFYDWQERSEMIKLAVEYGADLEARLDGCTVFLLNFLNAIRRPERQLIELLHDLGADVCAEDGKGLNAIMLEIERASIFSQAYDLGLLQYLVNKGVSVNHRDKKSRTPLMLAALGEQAKTTEYLIQAGADVNVLSTEEIESGMEEVTALSIWLSKIDLPEKLDVTEKLIRCGALKTLPARYNNYLHKMIQSDEHEMIQLLLENGMAPTMSGLLQFDPPGLVSPLTVALDGGNIPVIKYLLGNLMLCTCDMYGHSYFSQWRHKLISEDKTDVVTMMDEFYSQPKSLFQLSFVTVSHALGGVPGRVDRVNSLPLPSKVKDKLLFKNIDVPMNAMHSDDSDSNSDSSD